MKFTEVNPFNNKIQKIINKSILNTVKKKDFILGRNVKRFEEKFSKLSNSIRASSKISEWGLPSSTC